MVDGAADEFIVDAIIVDGAVDTFIVDVNVDEFIVDGSVCVYGRWRRLPSW